METKDKHKIWLQERSKGLGGSDAAAILGLNPWKTNVQLYREKIGAVTPPDISDKECVQFGHKIEPIMRDFVRATHANFQIKYDQYGVHRSEKYPFILGTLDGEITTNDGGEGILELKTTTINRAADWEKWNDKIPQNYYCQIMHYFLLKDNYKFANLTALLRQPKNDGGNKYTILEYLFERKECEEDIAVLLRAEIKFWECVQKRKEPGLILPEI